MVDLGGGGGRHARDRLALRPRPARAEIGRAVGARQNSRRSQDIVISRCSMCHAEEPVWAGLIAPPKGVLLDSAEQIRPCTRR